MRGGGTTRWLALGSASVLALAAATGCRPAATEEGPSETRATTSYESWRPTYADVRPATEADVDLVRERVDELNASSYTAALELFDAEVASTPEHVRVRFGQGGEGEIDLHLDPRRTDTDGPLSYVVCFAATDSCSEVGPESSSGEAPHMFGNMVDSWVHMLAEVVGAQRSLVEGLSASETSYATIGSPLGTLDCLVSGGSAEERAGLEGQAVDLGPDPVVREGEPLPVFPVCVDEHGLVITIPSLLTPIAPYTSFESGVPAGIDEHPAPVPYGEEPEPTPTAAPTETPSQDPGALTPVIIAREPIAVGESVREAQEAGRFELSMVPGSSVRPGTLTSTEGLSDCIAVVGVAAGAQVSADDLRRRDAVDGEPTGSCTPVP